MFHVICTRLRLGHVSVRVGDGSRRSEKIVNKISNCAFECCYYYYYYCYYYYYYYYYYYKRPEEFPNQELVFHHMINRPKKGGMVKKKQKKNDRSATFRGQERAVSCQINITRLIVFGAKLRGPLRDGAERVCVLPTASICQVLLKQNWG